MVEFESDRVDVGEGEEGRLVVGVDGGRLGREVDARVAESVCRQLHRSSERDHPNQERGLSQPREGRDCFSDTRPQRGAASRSRVDRAPALAILTTSLSLLAQVALLPSPLLSPLSPLSPFSSLPKM